MISEITTFLAIRRALRSSRQPVELVRKRQEEGLRRLLVHAYEQVPMYRRLYDGAGFHPSDFQTLDDLKSIPLLTKDLFKHTPSNERVATGTRFEECRMVQTSGSTGSPLKIAFGSSDILWQRAVAWRILFENGFRWFDRTMEIRMQCQKIHCLQRFGIAPKDWVAISDPPEHWVNVVLKTRPQTVVAGAGTLHALAEGLRDRGACHSARLVVSDSETLTSGTRMLVREVFGCDPCDVYGLEELSNFAWQCECRGGFHVSDDSHIVEVDGSPGEAGPLTATALFSRTTPMIRYETGDWAEPAAAPCACGRTLSLLSRIHGRSVDSINLPNGRKIFWPFFHMFMGDHSDISRWRVVQTERYRLRVDLQPFPGRRIDTRKLHADLVAELPEALTVELSQVKDFEILPGSKFRVVVAHHDASS